jgi:hypothetical protein
MTRNYSAISTQKCKCTRICSFLYIDNGIEKGMLMQAQACKNLIYLLLLTFNLNLREKFTYQDIVTSRFVTSVLMCQHAFPKIKYRIVQFARFNCFANKAYGMQPIRIRQKLGISSESFEVFSKTMYKRPKFQIRLVSVLSSRRLEVEQKEN